ncbi:MAG: hypothetical protein KDB60_02940 [Propionibacteriaceae bacterium]|nr:hypothetical protein [Propionibacteriaceae bacterium]
MAQPPQEPQWPTYRPDAGLPVPDAGSVPAPPRPGYSPQDPLVLAAGGKTLRKDGVWTVPPYIRIHGDIGSVRLDFRRATPASPVIQLDISGGVGTIVMVLPAGWAAQAERLRPGIGTRRIKVFEEPEPGHPVLVLSGSLGVGTMIIRYPNRGDERRLRRLLRREQRRSGDTPQLR